MASGLKRYIALRLHRALGLAELEAALARVQGRTEGIEALTSTVDDQRRTIREAIQQLDSFLGKVERLQGIATGLLDAAASQDRDIDTLRSEIAYAGAQAEKNVSNALELIAKLDGRLERRIDPIESETSRAVNLVEHIDRQITRLDTSLAEVGLRMDTTDLSSQQEISKALELIAALGERLEGRIEPVEADASRAINLIEHIDRQITRLDTSLAEFGRRVDTTDLSSQQEISKALELIAALGERLEGRIDKNEGETSRSFGLIEHVDQQITRLDASMAETGRKAEKAEQASRKGEGILSSDLQKHWNRIEHIDSQITRIDSLLAPLLMKASAPDDEQPIRFLVTSFGYSASRWLGWALNSHPDIVCSHGLNAPDLGLIYDRDFTPKEWERVFREHDDRRRMTLAQFFTEHEKIGRAKAYGNIHHYRIHELTDHLAAEGNVLSISVAELLRHPISIIESKFQANVNPKNVVNKHDTSLKAFHESLGNFIETRGYGDVCAEHGVDLNNFRVAMFFEAMELARRVGEEAEKAPHRRFILMEKITTDPQYFVLAFDMLFDGELHADRDYLQKVFRGQKMNQHRTRKAAATPARDYASWKPWQRAVVAHMFSANDAVSLFERFGYDFSFMKS